MTHHHRHWINTAILRRVAVFTLSMFESVAPLTQGQETADEEEEVLESLIDSPKAQDDKKKALEALLQEPEKHADQAAEQVEPSTTLSDSELYMLGLSLDERTRRFEQKLDGTQDTADALVRKAIADPLAEPIPVSKSDSPDRPLLYNGEAYTAPSAILADLISTAAADAAQFLLEDDEHPDYSAAFTPRQAASPLTRSLVSTAAGSGTVAPPAAAPLTYGGGAPAFSGGSFAGGGGAAGGGGGGGGAAALALETPDSAESTTPTVDFTLPTEDEIALQPSTDDEEDEKKKDKADEDTLLPLESALVANFQAPAVMRTAAPAGQDSTKVVWNGSNLTSGRNVEMFFDSTAGTNKLDVVFGSQYAANGYTVGTIIVNYDGGTKDKRGAGQGNVGYAFTSKLRDSSGNVTGDTDAYITGKDTKIVKQGDSILVLEMGKNDFGGGIDLQGGTLYVAEQGSLGTGTVTMHDGTAMWVNYAYDNTDPLSSFRNPLISNDINIVQEKNAETGEDIPTTVTISYGDFIWIKFAGNTSRIWRNLNLTGQLTGAADSTLVLQGYSSRYGNKVAGCVHLSGKKSQYQTQLWYSQFTLKHLTAEGKTGFQGTIKLSNKLNSSTIISGQYDDQLAARGTGAVRLNISDNYCKDATIDLTREYCWMDETSAYSKVANLSDINTLLLTGKYGTKQIATSVSGAVRDDYQDSYTLRQTTAAAVVVSGTAYVGDLKAELLGVTADSYTDLVSWNEQYEVKHVRVVTGEKDAHLVLGKDDANSVSWYAGTLGLAGQYYGSNPNQDLSVDDYSTLFKDDYDTGGSSVAGLSLTKTGTNTQYIHTAQTVNLVVEGGTLGFNHVTVTNNLQVNSGATLKLGVTKDTTYKEDGTAIDVLGWTGRGSSTKNYTDDTVDLSRSDVSQRLLVYTDSYTTTGNTKLPDSAVVDGNVTLGDNSLLSFELDARQNLTPIATNDELKRTTTELKEHSLLQVNGTLTLTNSTAITLSGIDFLEANYQSDTYYFAAASSISVVDSQGNVLDGGETAFKNRIITLHYGFYGILSTKTQDGVDFLVMQVKTDPTRSWTGSGVTTIETKDAQGKTTYTATSTGAGVWRALADVTDKYNTTTQDYNVYTGYYQPTYVTYTYKDGETGETKVQDDLSKVPNAQWKENVYYTDGASVKFGNLWLPEEWEKYLDTGNTTLESFQKLLTSSEVALGNGSKDGETDPAHGSGLFQSASTKITTRTSNGVSVTIDGITYGVDDEDNVNQVYGVFETKDGSTTFTKTTRDGISDYYERVMIDGTVRPGYITVNSDYELEIGGQSVAMKDDTNYVFRNYTDAEGKVHAGCIADASSRVMHDIYGDVVSTDETWRTKLAKGGTGTLIIETENTFSGGSDLHGGLIVMKNQQALGWSAESLKEGTFSKGGDIEMAYGAALMADYVSVQHTADNLGEELQEGVITNHLVITHAADYDEALWKVTGDAQIMNRWDTECRLDTLESYRDAVLTLRGVSRSKEDADTGIITTLDGKEVTEYKNTYADFAINTPKGARGTIRMAGYLYGEDGRIVNSETDEKGVTTYSYAHTGGNVQLTISGHMKEGDVDPTVRWEETTIDLSLNGSAHTVLALETRFKKDNVTENPGLTKTLVLGTLMDDGNSGGNACVINDASSKRMDLYYKDKGKEAYLVELTLKPTTDASFSGNVGFGIGQNAAGYALPSRGYISLVKAGSATQTIGNARLLDLNVGIGGETKDAATEEGGLLHITHALSVRSITTAGTWTTISGKDVVATLGRVMVGEVNETQSSHTLIVGAGGILAFETKQLSDKPLAGLKPTENQDKYGRDFSYILLQSATDSTVRDETSADSQTRTTPQSKEGAIVTAAGNYTISQSITVAKGSDVTFNTHEYSMDSTVSSTMDVYGRIAADMRDAFDKSHIIQLDGVFVAPEVTLNFTNKQISESAKGTNLWGTATYQGYILVKDMNEFTGNISGQDSTVYQEFGVSGTVNIGAMTCVQVTSSAAKKDNKFGTYQSLKCNQDVTEGSIDYNITGTNAALQFIENGSSGYNSFIKSAVLSDGGSVLMGGMAASEKAAGVIEGNATKADIDIRNNVDLVITNKTTVDEEGNSVADGEAKLSGFKLNTANQADQSVCGNTITVETALGGADKNTHAKIDNARVIAQTTNNLLEHTDLTNTLVEIQKNMTLYMSDVTLDSDSKIQGEVVAQTRSGTADGKVVNDRPGAQSNAYTDTATRVSVTLTQDNANTVTSNTQNKLQVMKVDQLVDVNMLGSGLTIGISQETLELYRATCDILALEVTGTGIFTYEANGMLSGVQLADTTTGNIYATTDTSNPIAIADSAYVAYLLGVEKAQVSMNYIYIVLPEPTTGTLSLLALAALCARRRTGAGKV